MAINYLISAIETTFFGLIFTIFFHNDTSNSYNQLLFEGLILIISFTLPNLVFLWCLFKFRIVENSFFKVPVILIEALLLYGIYYLINLLVEQLPQKILFIESSTNLTRRVYFGFYFELFYSFIILFIILMVYRKISNVLRLCCRKRNVIKLRN